MAEKTCPVQKTIQYLSKQIDSGCLTVPRERRICEQILQLTRDIAEGAAQIEHMSAIDSKIRKIENSRIIKPVKGILDEHRGAFQDHIASRNCPGQDCEILSPSPCQMACPAGIDIPTYLSLIAQGEDSRAIEVIRRDNPLPWVCGLVCTKPCETMCVRSRIDTPVSIKYLKAFAAKKVMAAGSAGHIYKNPEKKAFNGKKVCVVGAGPGGLSAAFYLALMGYGVHVIEALPVPGGMLMVGIPRYRLPGDVIKNEVAMLEQAGVEFSYNTRFGKDVTLKTLQEEGFGAFFIAIGAHKSWDLGIKGEKEFPRVLDAVAFLKDVALDKNPLPGNHVIIIGGGNVAIDSARTCLRLGSEKVTIAYRRSRDEMPADSEEIEQAEEEGVEFAFLSIPKEILGVNGTIESLACIKAQLVKKEGSDRLAPVPIENGDFNIPADTVICAIGQYVDDTGMEAFEGISWTRKGTIEVNKECMETSMPGVFAAGDAVTGPATVIEAIGGGKRAALAIDRYFNHLPQRMTQTVPTRHSMEPPIEMSVSQKTGFKRPGMRMLPMEQRQTTFELAELGFDEKSVRKEAARCLRCDICRRCQKCVKICRDEMGIGALQFGYMEADTSEETGYQKTDFGAVKEKCISCGACAVNCENRAIVLEEKDGERRLKLCGTILNSSQIRYCKECGVSLPSKAYTEFLAEKTCGISRTKDTSLEAPLMCDTCRRKNFARRMAL